MYICVCVFVCESESHSVMSDSLGPHGQTTQGEMVGWHHQLEGHEFEQALGVGDGRGEAWRAAVHGVAQRVRHD